MTRLAALLALALGLQAMVPTRAAYIGAPVSLVSFFAGRSVSAGEISTLGLFKETFTADFLGHTTGRRIELDERFRFAEGERLQRWVLEEKAGAIEGSVSTEDADGKLEGPFPVTGTVSSEGTTLRYRGIAPGSGRFLLDFRHEITPNGDGTLANHVRVSRFGLPLASSRVTFAKSAEALRAHVSPP